MNQNTHDPSDQNSLKHQSAFQALLNAPNPSNQPACAEEGLEERVSQLPAKYRTTYERICAAKREAAKELQTNQRANFSRMAQEESANQLLRLSVSRKVRPPFSDAQQQANYAGEQWARGVIDGQRAILEDYFLNLKQLFINQAESEHHRLRDRLEQARSRSRAKRQQSR